MLALPRVIIAGLSGGSGKTIVSLGLTRAMARMGLKVRPFKKGPDYIDAAWLSLAAGASCANLDQFMLDARTLRALFAERMQGFELGLIEGNRGIFDGKDAAGSLSTAELARQLRSPVVLVIDATKMTRTVAALVRGVNGFEEGFRISGVILNRVAGPRHEKILRESIENYTDSAVFGVLPKLPDNPIPERHMGLMSMREIDGQEEKLDNLAEFVAKGVDVEAVRRSAAMASSLGHPDGDIWPRDAGGEEVVIGVVRDAALWFYYPENIEALEKAGATVVSLSILDSGPWPELHGLYMGGGFPETQAARLAENSRVRDRVKRLSCAGLPIYAECGGFMYLCESLEYESKSYPMAGIFPLTTRLCPRPQGLGYVRARVERENPYHPKGEILLGHEFHYSFCTGKEDSPESHFVLRLDRGQGIRGNLDGLLVNNTYAGYTHIHALGAREWAPNFVAAARAYRSGLKSGRSDCCPESHPESYPEPHQEPS